MPFEKMGWGLTLALKVVQVGSKMFKVKVLMVELVCKLECMGSAGKEAFHELWLCSA